LNEWELQLSNAVFLILANKRDIAKDTNIEISATLGLDATKRPKHLQDVCALSG
jgi:hypothetical protein